VHRSDAANCSKAGEETASNETAKAPWPSFEVHLFSLIEHSLAAEGAGLHRDERRRVYERLVAFSLSF
jgi:hypothetical protein